MKKNTKASGKNGSSKAAVRLAPAASRNGSDTAGKKSASSNGQRLHPTRIDIPEKLRSQLCDILNETLATTLDLYTQTKQAHWNVKGVHFYQLHLLFDEMATELGEYTDLFAERITTLAGTAFGTVQMAAKASILPDYPRDLDEGMLHVAALADRYAQYAELLRENIDVTDHLGDKDTADIYTEVSRDIDKRLWFLEAHLQAASAARETGNPRVAAKPKR
jgi:starvation-inducible DNA-binding protein